MTPLFPSHRLKTHTERYLVDIDLILPADITWRYWPPVPGWCSGFACWDAFAIPCAGIAVRWHRWRLRGDTAPSHSEAGDTPPCTHTETQNIKALVSHDTMLASAASPHYLEIKPSAAERGMAGRSMVSEHDDWMMPSSMLTRISSSVSCKHARRCKCNALQ